MSKIIVC